MLLWQGNVRSLACGGLAGIITKVSVLPLDLAKKRLAVRGGLWVANDVSQYCNELILL